MIIEGTFQLYIPIEYFILSQLTQIQSTFRCIVISNTCLKEGKGNMWSSSSSAMVWPTLQSYSEKSEIYKHKTFVLICLEIAAFDTNDKRLNIE